VSYNVYPTLPGLTFGINRAPRWSTSVQTAITGRETRIALMQSPMYDVDLAYEFIRSSAVYPELQQLVNFFNQAQGSWDSWLFIDPDDNSVSNQAMGTGNGSTVLFPFLRSFGGFTELCWWLYNFTVYVNGVAKVYNVDYTVPSGYAQFVTPPAAGAVVTWTGNFYYRCRFKDDTLPFSKFMSQLWEAKKVSFVANLQGRLGTT
jgi:uncharacterized protein (TIGR02217 family)